LFPFKEKDYKKSMTSIDLFNSEPIENCITNTHVKNLDIIPSHIDLFDIEMKIATSAGSVNILKTAIKKSRLLDIYDFIFIDTPPNLGPFMLNAFVCSNHYIIPLESESVYSLEGLNALSNRISQIKEYSNEKLNLLGYLITMFDGRNSTCKSMTNIILNNFKNDVFKTKIRKNTDINKASAQKQTIFQFNSLVNGSKDYLSLSNEIIQKLNHE
jgi:chromosome partitioning protein